MPKYSYGISSFLIGDINPVDGTMLNPVEFVEHVYKDTFNVTEEEGQTVDHYSEMDTTPKVSFTDVGKENIVFQCMDTAVAQLARFFGGSVVDVGGRDQWDKPATLVSVEKSVKAVTSDGTDLEYFRVKVTPRKNFQLRRNGIWLLDITMTPLVPILGGLPTVRVTDPA